MAIVRQVVGQITLKVIKEVASTTYYYTLVASTASAPVTPTTNPPSNIWSDTEPQYITGDTRNLYITIQTLYSDNSFEYTTPSISSSYEAAKQAYNKAAAAELLANAVSIDTKYIWSNLDSNAYPTGTYAATAGIPGITFNRSDVSTYGFNSWLNATSLNFRYNAAPLTTIDINGLKLYAPVVTNGVINSSQLGAVFKSDGLILYNLGLGNTNNKGIELNNTGLFLYKPLATGETVQTTSAELTSAGLKLTEGGIEAGNPNQSGFIYLSTKPYGSYSINNSNGISDWKEIIGTKFGVRADGTLYAQDAVISGQITVGGVNGYDVQEALDNTIIFDTSYEFDNLNPHQTVTFTAHIYRGGVDITSNFYDEDFTWFYKTENNPTALPINTNTNNQNSGKTITFNLSNIGYGCEIVGRFEPTSEANLLDNSNNNLTDTNNTSLTTQATESGNSVRVRDLSYVTTLQQSDAIMAITSNSEKLITIANLANTLQTTSVQIVRW